jgi:hypothetical protein
LETPPGVQAQVDFARFIVDFTDDPGMARIVWLFSLVLGHSRFLFARYVLHRICRRCCAAIARRSRRSAGCRSRSSMTG